MELEGAIRKRERARQYRSYAKTIADQRQCAMLIVIRIMRIKKGLRVSDDFDEARYYFC